MDNPNSTPSLTIIIPCYNPRPNWAQRVADYFQAYAKASALSDVRLTVVNDGSTVNVSEADFQYLRQTIPQLTLISYAVNTGKGHALREGVRHSTGDFYLFTDVDFPYTLESMLAVEQMLLQKGGVVVGHRNTDYYEKVPLFRKILSRSFRWFIRYLLRVPVEDTQCGLKGFNVRGKEIFLGTTIDRFLFDLEFLVLSRGKTPVHTVPVQLRDGVRFSTMGVRILWRESRNFVTILRRRLLS